MRGDLWHQAPSDVLGREAVTVERLDDGVSGGQSLTSIPRTFLRRDFKFLSTYVDTEQKTDTVLVLDLSGTPVSHVVISPTVRGNPVVCELGVLHWELVNGIWYPAGYAVARQDSVIVPVPTIPNLILSFAPIFAGTVSGYEDMYSVVVYYDKSSVASVLS
jgi:hypothetical protein